MSRDKKIIILVGLISCMISYYLSGIIEMTTLLWRVIVTVFGTFSGVVVLIILEQRKIIGNNEALFQEVRDGLKSLTANVLLKYCVNQVWHKKINIEEMNALIEQLQNEGVRIPHSDYMNILMSGIQQTYKKYIGVSAISFSELSEYSGSFFECLRQRWSKGFRRLGRRKLFRFMVLSPEEVENELKDRVSYRKIQRLVQWHLFNGWRLYLCNPQNYSFQIHMPDNTIDMLDFGMGDDKWLAGFTSIEKGLENLHNLYEGQQHFKVKKTCTARFYEKGDYSFQFILSRVGDLMHTEKKRIRSMRDVKKYAGIISNENFIRRITKRRRKKNEVVVTKKH